LTDERGLPVKIVITPGQTHDIQAAAELLSDLRHGQMVLADRAYDADWVRAMVSEKGGSCPQSWCKSRVMGAELSSAISRPALVG
jgi:transposase